MHPKRAVHVFSTSYFLLNFIQDQLRYYKQLDISWFIACSPDPFLYECAIDLEFTPLPIEISRSISPLKDIKAIFLLYKFIKKYKIELVIGHTPKGAMIAMIAALLARVKRRIYFRHGILYETSKGFKRVLLKNIEKLTGICATNIICVSRSVLEFALKHKLNNVNKNLLLGQSGSCNGINLFKFNHIAKSAQSIRHIKYFNDIKNDDFIVGFVGRITIDKGVSDLIYAWRLLKKNEKFRQIKLLLAGSYDYRDQIPPNVKELINSDCSIIHLDVVTDIVSLYGMLDVLVLPSYREGMPTVILEASAMEVPIITTKATGCINAIIENKTGLFCSHDPENIAKQIKFYFDNPGIRRIHGKNGREFVKNNFNQIEIWNDFENKVLMTK